MYNLRKKLMRLKPDWSKLSYPSYIILKVSFVLSAAILTVTLCHGVYTGELTVFNVRAFRLGADLYRAPLGIMMFGTVGAALIEERSGK